MEEGKIEVRAVIGDHHDCGYCGKKVTRGALVEIHGDDNEPEHVTCIRKHEQDLVSSGKYLRCAKCGNIIWQSDRFPHEQFLQGGKYFHNGCKK